MRSDELTYSRAVHVSVLGFSAQFVLAFVVLLYAIFAVAGNGIDRTGLTIFFLATGGLLPWLGLILIFHQHRLDAIEAIEAERFAAAETSSVFEHADDLRIAQRRLAAMYKFLLPAISLGLAAYMVGIGLWRLSVGKLFVDIELYQPSQAPGWGVALGMIIGLVGFVLASFIAGMANQQAWQNLRGGAGAIVGTALAAFVMTVALGIEMLGYDWAARYLQVILPGYMIVLGIEIILNFLLNVYRPRTRGEIPRPAFDSQILALIAQPQSVAQSVSSALSYQFGFEVGETWFYQLLSRTVMALATLALLVIWGLSCLVIVEPNEEAIITRFGRIVRDETVQASGLHLKAPWPIERVERFESMRVHQIQLASQPEVGNDEPILWTNDHATNPTDYIIVAPSLYDEQEASDESQRDISLMNAEVPVQYRIKDILRFVKLAPERDRDELLKAAATRELTRYMATREVDEILGPRRFEIGRELQRRIQAAFDRLGPVVGDDGARAGAGVEVVFVGLANAHPPNDEDHKVAESFQAVVQATQEQIKLEEEGKKEEIRLLAAAAGSAERSQNLIAAIDALKDMQRDGADRDTIENQHQIINDLLREAGGRAAQAIAKARALRWDRHMTGKARFVEFEGRLEAYASAPTLYIWRQILDVYKNGLGQTRVFFNATDAKPHIRIDLLREDYQVPIQAGDSDMGE